MLQKLEKSTCKQAHPSQTPENEKPAEAGFNGAVAELRVVLSRPTKRIPTFVRLAARIN
jgi:hypothetical protein